jgi:hypothetical protein
MIAGESKKKKKDHSSQKIDCWNFDLKLYFPAALGK